MKAGVKEGDRIIKVSPLPSPPLPRGDRDPGSPLASAHAAHFRFDTSCQSATGLGVGTMSVYTVVKWGLR